MEKCDNGIRCCDEGPCRVYDGSGIPCSRLVTIVRCWFCSDAVWDPDCCAENKQKARSIGMSIAMVPSETLRQP